MRRFGPLVLLTFASGTALQAQANLLASPDRWALPEGATIAAEGGEPVLRLPKGSAEIAGLAFESGSIAFEMRLPPQRAFIGVRFRSGDRDAEDVYFRPHKSGQWDAIQYQPILNGSTTWQTHAGPGFSQAVDLPAETWIPVRLEVNGPWATLFVGSGSDTTMRITLQRGTTSGPVALTASIPGGPNGAVPAFRRVRIAARPTTGETEVDAPTPTDAFLRRWTVTGPLPIESLPVTTVPAIGGPATTVWAEPRGVINLNRHYARIAGVEHSAVVAETVLEADAAARLPLTLDYSDDVSVFLNGDLLFSGRNGWESRYPFYLGILHPAALTNTVWLPLRPGANRLTLVVSEQLFGWGFIARLEPTAGVRVAGN